MAHVAEMTLYGVEIAIYGRVSKNHDQMPYRHLFSREMVHSYDVALNPTPLGYWWPDALYPVTLWEDLNRLASNILRVGSQLDLYVLQGSWEPA